MDKILNKIEKLHAKAQGASTEAEAEAFAAKVQELLDKYNLEMHQVIKAAADFEVTQDHYIEALDFPHWKRSVALATAELYYCRLLILTAPIKEGHRITPRVRLIFAGQEHNARVAKSMGEYFFDSVHNMGKQAYDDQFKRLHFEHGCGTRLASRIFAKIHERKDSKSANTDNLPAVINQELAYIDDFLNKQNIAQKKHNISDPDSNIAIKGYLKGSDISLDNQIEDQNDKIKQITKNNGDTF